MQDIKFEFLGKDNGFKINDFPDAEKVVSINGSKAQELADMALHRSDLIWAENCLHEYEIAKEEFQQSVFWRSAVIFFVRCFGNNNGRPNDLDIKIVVNNEPGGLEAYEYFKDMRDKNFSHDDNLFLQSIPGAVINQKKENKKIAKIVTLIVRGEVSSNENINNLKLLISRAKDFVQRRYDELAQEIENELENRNHEWLLSQPEMNMKKPGIEHVNKNRFKIL